MPLRPGLSAAVELVVADADTALALRTGDGARRSPPPASSPSPRRPPSKAVDGELAEGTPPSGYRVQLDHLAPTAVGERRAGRGHLEAIEGRRLTFRVSVSDGHGLVAAGRITRVIVERARFLEKATGEYARARPRSPRGSERRRGTRASAAIQAVGFSNWGEWPAVGDHDELRAGHGGGASPRTAARNTLVLVAHHHERRARHRGEQRRAGRAG